MWQYSDRVPINGASNAEGSEIPSEILETKRNRFMKRYENCNGIIRYFGICIAL